jgi:hypothetical protein
MNLETLAAFRGEAWAKRVLRRVAPLLGSSSGRPWPGKMTEARKLAGALGRPQLVDALAVIIQERASVAWRLHGEP